ncbi:MAG TPA: histone deacetylase family protein [Dehalococcoidia bacterium]|nr:histone deacetylase family protein [Dehalococcoidia bacterium]
MKEDTAIIFSDGLSEYDFGEGHPFRGNRYDIFKKFFREFFHTEGRYDLLETEPATDQELLKICSKEYIDFTRNFFNTAGSSVRLTGNFSRYHSGDNIPREHHGKLEEAARLIIGQAKQACDLVSGGEYTKVISIGGGLHHAKPNYGEGFCLYNDVAFCGRYLLQEHGLSRILIIDTDAHAGNGTCEYFYDNPEVLFIDLHQDPYTLYPGTGFSHEIGKGMGTGYTINLPMPPYSDLKAYEYVFEKVVEPVVKEFDPQIIIRNGGSDPHYGDILTNLGLKLDGLYMLGKNVSELSSICDGKVVDLVASGYNMDVLPYGWLALIEGLLGYELSVEEPLLDISFPRVDGSQDNAIKMVNQVREILKPYWKCFSGD